MKIPAGPAGFGPSNAARVPVSEAKGFEAEFINYAKYPMLSGTFLAVNRFNATSKPYFEAVFVISRADGSMTPLWSTSGNVGKTHAPVFIQPVTAQKKLSNGGPWLVIKHENPEMLKYLKDNFWNIRNTNELVSLIHEDPTQRVAGHKQSELRFFMRELPPQAQPAKEFDPFEL